ncbi:MAG: MBL fold metallo-hydrolase RNA specificity domain-containing protein [Bacteroidia bacterium]
MEISFHGAAQTVTGSKHLVKLEDGTSFLLDCGMFQGHGKDTFGLNSHFGFDPRSVNFLILSHAHIDHSGLIPRLCKEGFEGKIYCTPATLDLCEVMLADSAHIQEADAKFINKKRQKQDLDAIKPLYEMEDVQKCLEQFVAIPYNEEHKINNFVRVTFTDNGHILGSACVNLRITEGSETKRLCFTGDIGRYNMSLLKDPAPFPQPDVLMLESTYGNRLHEEIENAESEILDAVLDTCLEKKGRLIIPAFSLGRTQEIIYALNKLDFRLKLPDIKIYVDSPLAISATNITRKYVHCLNEKVKAFMEVRPDPFGFDDVIYVNTKEESQKLNDVKEPCIIVSASGMADAGRVKHHIMHAIEDKKNSILIVGYAEPNSLAGRLRNGAEEVRIFGDMYKVEADVKIIDAFSAHGDYNEMIQYIKNVDLSKIKKTFLVHGELDVQEDFKTKLNGEGLKNIFIPSIHSSYFA